MTHTLSPTRLCYDIQYRILTHDTHSLLHQTVVSTLSLSTSRLCYDIQYRILTHDTHSLLHQTVVSTLLVNIQAVL